MSLSSFVEHTFQAHIFSADTFYKTFLSLGDHFWLMETFEFIFQTVAKTEHLILLT